MVDPAAVRELFDRAASVPARERDAFLASVCGENDALRRAVERLLAADPTRASYSRSRAARMSSSQRSTPQASARRAGSPPRSRTDGPTSHRTVVGSRMPRTRRARTRFSCAHSRNRIRVPGIGRRRHRSGMGSKRARVVLHRARRRRRYEPDDDRARGVRVAPPPGRRSSVVRVRRQGPVVSLRADPVLRPSSGRPVLCHADASGPGCPSSHARQRRLELVRRATLEGASALGPRLDNSGRDV